MAITFKSVLASIGGGYEINIVTSDSDLYGYTITISKDGSAIGTTTFDNSGEASYTVTETGTYVVSVVYDGVTYSENVVVSEIEVDLEKGFLYQRWLTYGEVEGTYDNLAEVLANELAVRKLMTKHASVDYLASFSGDDESVITIIKNDLVAKWTTRRAYALDTLSANASIKAVMDVSDAKLESEVPIMTSNTTPSGIAFASYEHTSGATPLYAYKAFDGDSSTSWGTSTAGGQIGSYLGYKFVSPVVVKKISVAALYASAYGACLKDFVFEGSNDNDTYIPLGSYTQQNNGDLQDFDVNNNTAYLYYRIRTTSYTYRFNETGTDYNVVSLMLFVEHVSSKYDYGKWSLMPQVPKMTSNTAPYGEVIYSSQISNYAAFKAFDGNSSTFWLSTVGGSTTNEYIGYDFGESVVVKSFSCEIESSELSYVSSLTYKIVGSNTGNTDDWHDVSESYTEKTGMNHNLNNDVAYRYYAFYIISQTMTSGNASCGGIGSLQFYAYAPEGCVPIMTSNTAPYGECFGGTTTAGSYYNAFKGEAIDPIWCSTTIAGNYLGYKSVNPINVKRVRITGRVDQPNRTVKDFKLQGSNDGSTYKDIGTFECTDKMFNEIDCSSNTEYYLYHRVYVVTNYGDQFVWFSTLQFYGRELSENVPKMTTNTTPFGEASARSVLDSSSLAFYAFDGSLSNRWHSGTRGASVEGEYLEYDFISPVCVKRCVVNHTQREFDMTAKIQAYDGIAWQDLTDTITIVRYSVNTVDISNDTSYSKYRLYFLTSGYYSGSYNYAIIDILQFFGVNYGEYDWDTDNPRHYLYDSGLELENITAYMNGSTTVADIGFNAITLSATTDNNKVAEVYAPFLDLTPYVLMRCVIKNATIFNSRCAHMGVGSSMPVSADAGLSAKVTVGSDIPYNTGLDVSSINQEVYPAIVQTNGGSPIKAEISEWWLE